MISLPYLTSSSPLLLSLSPYLHIYPPSTLPLPSLYPPSQVPKNTPNFTLVSGMEDGWVFQRECNVDGKNNAWTGLQPACKPVSCPVPGTKRGAKIPKHGVVADRVSTCTEMSKDIKVMPLGDTLYADAYCYKSTYRLVCGKGYVNCRGRGIHIGYT